MPEIAATEAGKRCSDLVQQKIVDGHAGRWLAIRLSDGGGDGVPYDTKAHAIDHQLHETQCAYVQIPRDHMSPREAARYLELNRMLYDSGARIVDPDAPDRDVMIPDKIEDVRAAVADLERQVGLAGPAPWPTPTHRANRAERRAVARGRDPHAQPLLQDGRTWKRLS